LAMLDGLVSDVTGLVGRLAEGGPDAASDVESALSDLKDKVLQERQRYALWMDKTAK